MAFVIDDFVIGGIVAAEVVAGTTEVAAETTTSGVEIAAEGSTGILDTSGIEVGDSIEVCSKTTDVTLDPNGSFDDSSAQITLPEKNIFVDDLPTDVESAADMMPKGELFVDEYQPNIESQEATSLPSDSLVDEYSAKSDVPIENMSTSQESMESHLKVESIETEQPKRDPNRFSEKNQYATSEQIQEYRNNPENEPLLEGYGKDADVLRSNMEKVMGEDAAEINKSNSRAHHIVGDNEYSGESKAILEKYDIDINAPENGIFLPQDETSDLHGTIHNGKHTMAYNDEVTQRLKAATCKEDVLEILDSIKEDLYNGDMELYNNHKYNV